MPTPHDPIYSNNPDVIAYIKIENNNIVFDFDESKGSVEDIMIVLNNLVGQYLIKNKENTNG